MFFGSFDESLHPRVAVLREGFAANGFDVTVINEPLGLSTADKLDAASSLSGMFRLLTAILRAWLLLWRRGRKVLAPDLVVVGYLGHFDVHLARLVWRDAVIALDHMVGLADTARDRGVARGIKYRVLALLDNAAMRRADIVVTDTFEQANQIPDDLRDRCVVVHVGATHVWSRQPKALPPPPLKVCFVGLYTPLHGAVTIGRAIAEVADDPSIRFTMVGSGQDLDATRAAAGEASVEWIDWVDSKDLPQLVAAQHVCLGIFGTTPKALRVVPNKVYQGLAAGNLVVTSDTPAQRRVLGDAALYVPPGDHQALADCLRSIAADPVAFGIACDETRATAADSTGVRLSADRSREFTPEAVVQPLISRRDAMSPKVNLSAGPALPPNAWLRFDVVRHHLEDLNPSQVLEIGPGRGAVAARLVSAGHCYTGVEMSDEAREATSKLLVDLLPLDGRPECPPRMFAELGELGDDELFEVVCAFEVLEHIEDDVAALGEWSSRVRPGGRLVISVPAWPHRYAAHDLEVGHVRRYSPGELEQIAIGAGLVDVRTYLYGFPLGYGLENIRNVMSKRLQKGTAVEEESAIERTKRSNNWFQPPRSANRMIQLGTLPFRIMQRVGHRVAPRMGTGVVLVGHRPLGDDVSTGGSSQAQR